LHLGDMMALHNTPGTFCNKHFLLGPYPEAKLQSR
jgi:hypothetical protein